MLRSFRYSPPDFWPPHSLGLRARRCGNLRHLLGALWKREEMQLTLFAGERELMEIPLYDDPSYGEVLDRDSRASLILGASTVI